VSSGAFIRSREESVLAVTDAVPKELLGDEIRAAIESFDSATHLRLEQAAARLADGRGIEADDLLHEAVVRSLKGDRVCPRDVPVAVFLFNVMKSLACSALKTKRRSKRDENTDVYDDGMGDENSDSQSAEDLVLGAEAADELINEMTELFAEDEDAQLVLMGLCQEMSPDEIQADCNLSKTDYNTIRRRIRRKLNDRYPKGWQS
jgi:RNA polymerase sigma-70 factor (ECF subfamily)